MGDGTVGSTWLDVEVPYGSGTDRSPTARVPDRRALGVGGAAVVPPGPGRRRLLGTRRSVHAVAGRARRQLGVHRSVGSCAVSHGARSAGAGGTDRPARHWPFVLFYGAGEAILGVATGVLVEHANDVPAQRRPAAAASVNALWDNFLAADLLIGIGSVAWLVAVVAAAVAWKAAGGPLAASILLGLSALTVFNPPPLGPLGLLCFAAAVGVLAYHERAGEQNVSRASRVRPEGTM